ncbi:hypothetical protein DMN91_010820 [Ooceraea biroi]|uniref:Tc1-like transposase DDE domain-containing protein n=2 Tax=Ooceraea biroi TaxID=2015173 RepID=A0A3L8D9D8_OOCBI|nr:hypothetical protein DMN91_010820 [Ooceraea biroi]
MHYWAPENPHWMREIDHQRRWSINVWCGILGNQVIGPYFIEGQLTGQKYATFITEILPALLENVPLNIRLGMWYMHDGCPAHYARVSREALHRQFPHRWIGRDGEFLWPPRSPDLTPMDYFLWGTLKNTVYCEPPTTVENMKDRILETCNRLSSETI